MQEKSGVEDYSFEDLVLLRGVLEEPFRFGDELFHLFDQLGESAFVEREDEDDELRKLDLVFFEEVLDVNFEFRVVFLDDQSFHLEVFLLIEF